MHLRKKTTGDTLWLWPWTVDGRIGRSLLKWSGAIQKYLSILWLIENIYIYTYMEIPIIRYSDKKTRVVCIYIYIYFPQNLTIIHIHSTNLHYSASNFYHLNAFKCTRFQHLSVVIGESSMLGWTYPQKSQNCTKKDRFIGKISLCTGNSTVYL